MIRKFIVIFILLATIQIAFAQNGLENVKTKIIKIFEKIFKFLFSFLILISGTLLIFLGTKYILGSGDIKNIHTGVSYVLLGIVILLLASFIPNLIKSFIESLIGQ